MRNGINFTNTRNQKLLLYEEIKQTEIINEYLEKASQMQLMEQNLLRKCMDTIHNERLCIQRRMEFLASTEEKFDVQNRDMARLFTELINKTKL